MLDTLRQVLAELVAEQGLAGEDLTAALLSIALMLAAPWRGQLRGRPYRSARTTRGNTCIHLPDGRQPAEAAVVRDTAPHWRPVPSRPGPGRRHVLPSPRHL